MILVDANLLLYAKVADYAQHPAARAWLEARLNEPGRVGLPWPSLLAFVRIRMNPRVFPRPLGAGAAWQQVEEWLGRPQVWVPPATERHAEVLGRLLRATNATSALVADAHLAALAIEHGLTLCSTDGDFARFPGLRWENPIA
jgi:hypothetical protein